MKRLIAILLAALATGCCTAPKPKPDEPVQPEPGDDTTARPKPNCADPATQALALKFLPVVSYILFDPACGKNCDLHLSRLEKINYAATACAAQAANEQQADQGAGK